MSCAAKKHTMNHMFFFPTSRHHSTTPLERLNYSQIFSGPIGKQQYDAVRDAYLLFSPKIPRARIINAISIFQYVIHDFSNGVINIYVYAVFLMAVYDITCTVLLLTFYYVGLLSFVVYTHLYSYNAILTNGNKIFTLMYYELW